MANDRTLKVTTAFVHLFPVARIFFTVWEEKTVMAGSRRSFGFFWYMALLVLILAAGVYLLFLGLQSPLPHLPGGRPL